MEFCSRIEFKKISDFHKIICKFHNCVYNTLEASVERLLCERSKFLNGILHEFSWELANPRSETSWIKLPDKSRLFRLLRLQKTALGKVHKLLPLKNTHKKMTFLIKVNKSLDKNVLLKNGITSSFFDNHVLLNLMLIVSFIARICFFSELNIGYIFMILRNELIMRFYNQTNLKLRLLRSLSPVKASGSISKITLASLLPCCLTLLTKFKP